MKIFIIIVAIILACTNLNAQDSTKKELKIDMSKMKIFYLVLLKNGNNRNQDSTTAANIQRGHLENIMRLADEGKIVMAGPIAKRDGELRGIFVFNAESENEVEDLVKTDPAVTSGRLIYEIYPWFAEKGTCLPEE